MTKDELRLRDEAVCAFARAYPDKHLMEIMALVDDLRRIAKSAQRNAENLCNLANYADKRDSLRARVVRVFKTHGLVLSKVKVGGDPRGYCLKIILSTGEYNTWGGAEDGWGL